jgi:hypothetical protein
MIISYVELEVLTKMTVEITVFSKTRPCSVVKFYRRFEENIPMFKVED